MIARDTIVEITDGRHEGQLARVIWTPECDPKLLTEVGMLPRNDGSILVSFTKDREWQHWLWLSPQSVKPARSGHYYGRATEER